MRIIKWILAIALLSSILCGCSAGLKTKQTSYLDEQKREAIESGILNGLEFVVSNNSVVAKFQNTSQYTLVDVCLAYKGYSGVICSVPYMEPGVSASIYSGTPQNLQTSGDVQVVYTVGEFTYYSDLTVPVHNAVVEESSASNEFTLTFYTDDGTICTDLSEPLEFSTGEELAGLKKIKIYSIAQDQFWIQLRGEKPDGYYNDLIYKIRNQDGIIVECGNLYFFDQEDEIYLENSLYGDYVITFEEK